MNTKKMNTKNLMMAGAFALLGTMAFGAEGESLAVAPCARLYVWEGDKTEEPEVAVIMDKSDKGFYHGNRNQSKDAENIAGVRTMVWDGFIRLDAGNYVIGAVAEDRHYPKTTVAFNDRPLLVVPKPENRLTDAKRVEIPASGFYKVNIRFSHDDDSWDDAGLRLRYKLDGADAWTYVAPKDLFHAVKK